MSWRERGGDEERQEDEDEDQESQLTSDIRDREYLCFLVDCSASMFELLFTPEDMGGTDEDEPKSSFSIVMSTIADFMKKRIVSGARDEFAVVLYNTREAQNEMNHSHVYVLVKRDQPSADTIQQLSSMTDEAFQRKIGSLQVDLADPEAAVAPCDALKCGLWSATDSLQSKSSRFARPRIIMFSNTQDPFSHLPSKTARAQYKQLVLDRVEPLRELGTTLRFFPLVAAKRPFSMAAFWTELMSKLPDPDDEFTPSLASQLSQQDTPAATYEPDSVMDRLRSLADYMKRCMQKRRATSTLRWTITPDTVISCQVYDLMVEASKPYAIKLNARTNEPLSTITSIISEQTGAVLQRVEYKAFVPEKLPPTRFPKVVWSIDEVSHIKYYLPAGIKLLGFKPRTYLQEYHNLTHSSFLRPTERDIKGSTAVFRALLTAMLKRDNIAVCRYVRNKRAEPRLVALLPQAEEVDAQGYQVWAEGLHMIRLPFKEDIRRAEEAGEHKLVRADADQQEAARRVVHELAYVNFAVGSVPNPAIERHFQVLECLAQGPDVEPPSLAEFEQQDATLPPPEIDQSAGEVLEAFKQAVGLSGDAGGAGSKRKAVDNLSTAEAYAQRGPEGWSILARENKLNKLTVADLKVYLKFHKLSQTGKKEDLIGRIREHMQM